MQNTNIKVLLTGGRGPAVLDFARRFSQENISVYMAESRLIQYCRFSNAIKKNIRVPDPVIDEEGFISGLINIIERFKIDWLLPGYDEVYFIAKHKHRFPEGVKILCDDVKTIDQLNNKYKFMQLLKENDLHSAQTVYLDNAQTLHEVMTNQHFPRPCVIKSIYSAGGVRVKSIDEQTDADAVDVKFPCIAQARIPGRVWSTYSIAHEGRMTFFCSYYPLYVFRENGAAICFKSQHHPGVFELVRLLIEKTGYTGQIGFDVIERADGTLWAIESNPRITSGIHLTLPSSHFCEAVLNPNAPLHIMTEERMVQISRMSMIRVLFHRPQSSFKTWLKYFAQAKDVLFDWHDPLPSFVIPIIGFFYMKQYLTYKKPPEDNIFLNVDWDID